MGKQSQSSPASSTSLDAVFFALADPTRRAILERLAEGEATVGTVAEPHDMAKPSISKHVKVLEQAGLITRRVEGREHWLRLAPEGFSTPAAWFTHYQQFWSDSVDRLGRLLGEDEKGNNP